MTGSTPKKTKRYMGVDPTTKGVAYTIISSSKKSLPPIHISSGKIETGEFPIFCLTALSLIKEHRVREVGIEIPGQYGKIGFEGAYLPITAIWIGALTSAIRGEYGDKVKIHYYPAQVNKKNVPGKGWRYYLFGKVTRKSRKQWDDWVKDQIENHDVVRGYPARSNKDVRDSTMIAIALRSASIQQESNLLGVFQPERYHDYIVSGRKR